MCVCAGKFMCSQVLINEFKCGHIHKYMWFCIYMFIVSMLPSVCKFMYMSTKYTCVCSCVYPCVPMCEYSFLCKYGFVYVYVWCLRCVGLGKGGAWLSTIHT